MTARCFIMQSMKNDKDTISNQVVEGFNPTQIMKLNILPGVSLNWLYKHWVDLGGVTIGRKKFVLKEELYANLKSKERKVLCESAEKQETVYTCKNGDVRNELDYKICRKESRGGVKVNDREQAIIDHSDPFGLT